jgi:general secretion pathway protein M
MTLATFLSAGPARRQALSAITFLLVIASLLGAAYAMATILSADEAGIGLLRARARELGGRAKSNLNRDAYGGGELEGSPFLEGQTVALAGAALQQRIERSVAKTGGVLLSSQIDLGVPRSKDRFLSLTVSLEITEPELQTFLYDLEAGIPYLFVDSFEAQGPAASGAASNGRMRVTMTVSGEWEPSL